MLGVEDVGRGRVVDDDGILEVPSDLGEVLDIVPLVIVAGLAEEAVMDHIVDIELVQERVAILKRLLDNDPKGMGTGHPGHTYLGDRSREDDDFIQLSYPLHELIYTRSLYDVHIVVVALYFYRNGEIGLVKNLGHIS